MQLVSLLQWHLFSMQWSIRSHRSTHQWIWSYVHMQLVSLLQWWVQSRSLQWASRSVSLLQWHRQCNDLSSHRSIYQWIDSSISSHATSESASMTSFVNAMIYKHIALSISESIYLEFLCQLVSLLQRRVRYWSRHQVSHSIVSLLERHSKWVCYKDRQRLIFWLSRSTNETSSTM